MNYTLQVILITDGSTGTGEGSLTTFLDQYKNTDGKGLPLPFPFPSKLHIVCLGMFLLIYIIYFPTRLVFHIIN